MSQRNQAEKIVKEHVLWSLGAGLVPLPLLDIAAVTLVQLDMIRQLCRLYNRKYSESEGKTILSALTGSTLAKIGSSMIKALPGVGTLLGGVSMSIMSGASTYAVAQVAILHFESGGTLFDFDMDTARQTYDEAFESGEKYASDLEREKKATRSDMGEIIKTLEKLAELKEKGILSAEEFDAKKQQLLEQL